MVAICACTSSTCIVGNPTISRTTSTTTDLIVICTRTVPTRLGSTCSATATAAIDSIMITISYSKNTQMPLFIILSLCTIATIFFSITYIEIIIVYTASIAS